MSPEYCSATMPCRPYRFRAYCPLSEDFLELIRVRRQAYTDNPASVLNNDGYWYFLTEDKLAAKLFAREEDIAMPKLYFCSTDTGELLSWVPSSDADSTGFVVKPLGLHSNAGVFILPNGFGNLELLSGTVIDRNDIQFKFQQLGVERYIVEEYIPGPAANTNPDEFKIHIFPDGTVGSITYITNRGNSCGCFIEVDQNWERLDEHGCYRSERKADTMNDGECTRIDFRGRQLVQTKGLEMCGETPPAPARLNEILNMARTVVQRVGVYIRVDVLYDSVQDRILVGEFTPGHSNGSVHCSAKIDANGCVDPCFLGRMWGGAAAATVGNGSNAATTGLHGGGITPIPSALSMWDDANWAQMCTDFLTSAVQRQRRG